MLHFFASALFLSLSSIHAQSAPMPSSPTPIVGVGLILEQSEGGSYYVSGLVKGAPAEIEGSVQPCDKLIGVQPEPGPDAYWRPVIGLPSESVVELIRGEEGTLVALDFIRDLREFSIVLTRAPFLAPIRTPRLSCADRWDD